VLLASFISRFFSSQAFVFLPPVRLTLTPRLLGTIACVCCFCECFCGRKKLSHWLKKIFSPGTSHHGSGSHSLSDGMLLDLQWFSSSMPSQHEATLSSHQPLHMETPPIDDDDGDISICSHEELARFESLHVQEFAHTRVYDVSLLEHVGLDIELPTNIRSIGWGKLYDEPSSAIGSCIGGCLGPSHRAGTSTSAEFPYWYYPLESYINSRVDQAECTVEGIGRIKSRMDEFKHMQPEIPMPINSQTGMLHNLFDHFSIDPDA
jgi:hypothetical protein